jgi:hypothetical protein
MRILDIIAKSIEIDILTAEEEVERLINEDGLQTQEKIDLIKTNLNQIINSQLIFSKLMTYYPQTNLNNDIESKKDNE